MVNWLLKANRLVTIKNEHIDIVILHYKVVSKN